MIEANTLTGQITPNQTLTGTLDYREVDKTKVEDVKVNGTSVVADKIANIDLTGKQDVLTAGTNITIENNVISATSGNNNDVVKFVNWAFPGDNKKITDTNVLQAMQSIMTYYITNQTVPEYYLNSCLLSIIEKLNSSQESNYDRYRLVFYGVSTKSTRFSIQQYQLFIYTQYNSATIYDDTSQSYYPRTGTTNTNTAIANNEDFNNYLHKQNTSAYTPTGDYNPATKKYVDDTLGDIETLLGGI